MIISDYPKILIVTWSLNGEKTIGRAIKSVLNQTYSDYNYFIIDNGSSDNTKDVINNYVKSDSRLHFMRNDKNLPDTFLLLKSIFDQYSDFDYLVELDADDEYHTKFLEEMLIFINKNNLDIACCGSNFVDSKTGKIVGKREIGKSLILYNDAEYNGFFPYYHQFIRTVWAKIFSSSVINKLNLNQLSEIGLSNGQDTLFTTAAFFNAKRIGIMQDILHTYYINPKSTYYTWNINRERSNHVLLEYARDLLIEKCGYISSLNNDFLLCVYYYALKDTISVLLKSNLKAEDQLSIVVNIVLHTHTKELMTQHNLGKLSGNINCSELRIKLFYTILEFILSFSDVPDEIFGNYCEAGELLSAVIEDSNSWIHFKKLYIQYLISESRNTEAIHRLTELELLLPDDTDISKINKK